MTEDDTFRVLSRASFEELRTYWILNRHRPVCETIYWIKSKGWSFAEFSNEWNKRDQND